jgi:ribosomal protein S27E
MPENEQQSKQKTVKFHMKKDKYMKVRGGYGRFLNIGCGNCGNAILLYQKDGPGSLLRMYLDRIFAPPELTIELAKVTSKDKMKSLICPKCKEVLAVPMIYESENRLALRVTGLIAKKINKTGEY